MIETWFISDTHFGHKNILEYEKDARTFETVEQMNETIIDRWNSVVDNKDIVYHLGDFAFGKRYIDIAGRLNGHKRLVLGNHDTYPSALYLSHFEKLYGVVFWERCVLSHMPVHPNGLGARWMLNVHGHLHSKCVQRRIHDLFSLQTDKGPVILQHPHGYTEDDPNYLNVSCEQNNLTPIHRDIIMARLKELD